MEWCSYALAKDLLCFLPSFALLSWVNMAISWIVSKKVTFTPQFLLIHSNSIIQFQLSNFFSSDLTLWPVKRGERSPVHVKHPCAHGKQRSFWFCCQYQRNHAAAFDFLVQTPVLHMQSNKELPSDQDTACRQDQTSCLCMESHTDSPKLLVWDSIT